MVQKVLPMTSRDRTGEQLSLAVGYIHHTDGYFWTPQRLLDTCIHYPRALGLWSLITRLWIGYGQPTVPLSDNDLRTYGNYAGQGRGTVLDDLSLLTKYGFLIAQRQRGKKTHYTPAWGMDRQHQPRPWKRIKGWNRGTTKTVRVSNTLIDAYVGRFIPNATKRGTVDRYTAEPLSLIALGQYMLNLRGRGDADCAELITAGLVSNGDPVPVPVLSEALATRPLTDSGTRRLAKLSLKPQDQPSARSASFFLWQVTMILIMIQHLIPLFGKAHDGSTASESAKSDATDHDSNPTRMKCMEHTLADPPIPPLEHLSGGNLDHIKKDLTKKNEECLPTHRPQQPRRRSRVMSIPDTPTALALRAINVRPKQIIELADLPLTTVEAVIAGAQDREDEIDDVAGWVVSVLRDMRDHGWQLTSKKWKLHTPEEREARIQRFNDFFRPNEGDDLPLLTTDSDDQSEDSPDAGLVIQDSGSITPALLTSILHRDSQHAVIRFDYDTYFQRLHVVSFQNQFVVLGIPSITLRSVVEDRFSSLIRRILGDYLGYPVTVRFVIHVPPPPTPIGVGESAPAQIAAPPALSDPYADQSDALQTALKAQLEPRQRGFANDLQIVTRTDTSITLLASNRIAQQWLIQNGDAALRTALTQLGWHGTQIDLQVRGKRR